MAFQELLTFKTAGRGFTNITSEIRKKIPEAKITNGLCHLFILHTSASLLICENADSQVLKDLENFMQRLVPDGDPLFLHTAEGDDDMPAHIRSVLTQTQLTLPISDQQLVLGTWQGIFLWEHRFAAFQRKVMLTII